MLCSQCQGSGKLQHAEPEGDDCVQGGWQVERTCDRCQGTGQTKLVPFPQTCDRCRGTGVVEGALRGHYPSGMPARERRPCPDCGGSGKHLLAAELPDLDFHPDTA
jgi:DnaJ-class molecular chaperone